MILLERRDIERYRGEERRAVNPLLEGCCALLVILSRQIHYYSTLLQVGASVPRALCPHIRCYALQSVLSGSPRVIRQPYTFARRSTRYYTRAGAFSTAARCYGHVPLERISAIVVPVESAAASNECHSRARRLFRSAIHTR